MEAGQNTLDNFSKGRNGRKNAIKVEGGIAVYSHSRLSTFQQCPLRFKYQYIDELDTDIEGSVEAFLGSRVHETLEKLYEDLKFEKLNSLPNLLDYYNDEWRKAWNDKILIVRSEYEAENYRLMGERFISDYYNKYHPFNSGRTLGLETRIHIKLDPEGKYQVQGFIDRLTSVGDGVYEIHDYKTSNSLPEQDKLDADRQLALYSIAVKEKYADCKRVILIWHYLAFDQELRSERTDAQLEELKESIITLIKKIELTTEFPPVESSLCSWCEFRPICPKWSHLYELEKKTPEEFKEDDGVKLADEYATLKFQEQEIQKKLEQVQARIFMFSEQRRMDRLFGSNIKLTIWKRSCVKFPSKMEMGYSELVKAVREAGSWEEYSTLDKWKLEKQFESVDMDPKLMQTIAMFGKKDLVKRIYLAKS